MVSDKVVRVIEDSRIRVKSEWDGLLTVPKIRENITREISISIGTMKETTFKMTEQNKAVLKWSKELQNGATEMGNNFPFYQMCI